MKVSTKQIPSTTIPLDVWCNATGTSAAEIRKAAATVGLKLSGTGKDTVIEMDSAMQYLAEAGCSPELKRFINAAAKGEKYTPPGITKSVPVKIPRSFSQAQINAGMSQLLIDAHRRIEELELDGYVPAGTGYLEVRHAEEVPPQAEPA